MAVLKQFKTSLVGALFLVFIALVGTIATWRLCVEVMSFRLSTVAWSFNSPPSRRIRAVLLERNTPKPDAAFDAYQSGFFPCWDVMRLVGQQYHLG